MATGIPFTLHAPDGAGRGSAPALLGHNGGPPLEVDTGRSWRRWCWARAQKQAWKTPPREIVLRRLRRARALGMSYHDYTLEILERGRYL